MLDTFMQSLNTDISPFMAVETMCVSFVLGIIVSITYMITAEKEDYSRSFCYTLVIVPVAAAVVIQLIGNSIASALSISGAFALIRFRSEAGNPKNISYILATVAIGLACGLGYYIYGLAFTILLAFLMIVLTKLNFGNKKIMDRKLKILIPENLDYEGVFDDILAKFTISHELVRITTLDLGSVYELDYKLVMNKECRTKEFIDELRCRNGNLSVSLFLEGRKGEF